MPRTRSGQPYNAKVVAEEAEKEKRFREEMKKMREQIRSSMKKMQAISKKKGGKTRRNRKYRS
jgi:hypothetical protein